MDILGDLLGTRSLDRFRSDYLRRSALARAGTARAYSDAFTWDDLDAVLRATPPPDVLVVAGGHRLPVPIPASLAETRVLMSGGAGLALRRTERCHPGLAALADVVGAELGGTVHVQLFATPAGTHGFGWHYDDEDVLILQTAGIKDYYFRANTVAGDLTAAAGRFARFERETSPLCTAHLIAGDVLYLPSRWWHMAVCREDALSISLGITLR